jgi:hypothetical protein
VSFSTLPSDVNTALDESRAGFTSDGRYLGFIRHGADGHDVLVVWDTTTQTTLSSTDLGAVDPGVYPGGLDRSEGSVSLYEQPLFSPGVHCCQTIIFVSSQSTAAGLLIERVTGDYKLFGRTGPRLRVVGRFPLGKFGKGRHTTHWDFTVAGHQLPPGEYYVTLRAITPKLSVRDLSRPFRVQIRNGRPPLVAPV